MIRKLIREEWEHLDYMAPEISTHKKYDKKSDIYIVYLQLETNCLIQKKIRKFFIL